MHISYYLLLNKIIIIKKTYIKKVERDFLFLYFFFSPYFSLSLFFAKLLCKNFRSFIIFSSTTTTFILFMFEKKNLFENVLKNVMYLYLLRMYIYIYIYTYIYIYNLFI